MSYEEGAHADGPKTLTTEKARAGQMTGHVRIILAVSSILAIVALLIVLFAFVHPAAQT